MIISWNCDGHWDCWPHSKVLNGTAKERTNAIERWECNSKTISAVPSIGPLMETQNSNACTNWEKFTHRRCERSSIMNLWRRNWDEFWAKNSSAIDFTLFSSFPRSQLPHLEHRCHSGAVHRAFECCWDEWICVTEMENQRRDR